MNYKTWTRCATRTGRKIDELMLPDTEEDYDNHHTTLYDGTFDGETHYLVDGVPTERPAQSTTLDVDIINVKEGETATFSDLPDPCIAEISNADTGYQKVTVEGGTLEFQVAIPGDYAITISAFPFLPWDTTIHAV